MDHKKAVLYGLAIWTIPFISAMIIFPLRATERPLFESIIPVALTFSTTLFTYQYFKIIKKRFVWQGLCLGIIWTITSLILDALFFSWGPQKMSLINYIKDIGITYLIIFIIPLGFSYFAEYKK